MCLVGGIDADGDDNQVRCLGLSPDAKRYQKDKAVYQEAVRTVRKQYIDNVRARAEAEQAKKR